MKHLAKAAFLLTLIFLCSSCSKEICTTCTEISTQISQEFCSTDEAEVEQFEDEVIDQAIAAGQQYICVK